MDTLGTKQRGSQSRGGARACRRGFPYSLLPTSLSFLPTPTFAWVSLDEDDNDPARFLAYSIAALRTIEANIAKGVLSALQSPQPPPAGDILTVLINEIAAIPGRVILFLDDYHLIEAEPVHDALTFLLEHLPLQMHLVVATREDLPLPHSIF